MTARHLPEPPVRHPGGRIDRITVVLPVAFTIAIALLGAFLGVLADVLAADPAATDFRPKLWTCLYCGIAGSAALTAGTWLWNRRRVLLQERGTAYVVEEWAVGWTHEDHRAFLSRLHHVYVAVRHVPGPSTLGAEWHWPLDERATEWNARVNELVRAFWAVHTMTNRAHTTRSSGGCGGRWRSRSSPGPQAGAGAFLWRSANGRVPDVKASSRPPRRPEHLISSAAMSDSPL